MRKFIIKIMMIASVSLIVPAVQAKIIVLKGGTVHTLGKKGVLKNATIVIENGKIKRVGQNVTIPSGAEVIDATGKIVVPGFMHSGSHLGLSEITMDGSMGSPTSSQRS